jgi:hypothetical protein
VETNEFLTRLKTYLERNLEQARAMYQGRQGKEEGEVWRGECQAFASTIRFLDLSASDRFYEKVVAENNVLNFPITVSLPAAAEVGRSFSVKNLGNGAVEIDVVASIAENKIKQIKLYIEEIGNQEGVLPNALVPILKLLEGRNERT